jgi:hypothetical protein
LKELFGALKSIGDLPNSEIKQFKELARRR